MIGARFPGGRAGLWGGGGAPCRVLDCRRAGARPGDGSGSDRGLFRSCRDSNGVQVTRKGCTLGKSPNDSEEVRAVPATQTVRDGVRATRKGCASRRLRGPTMRARLRINGSCTAAVTQLRWVTAKPAKETAGNRPRRSLRNSLTFGPVFDDEGVNSAAGRVLSPA